MVDSDDIPLMGKSLDIPESRLLELIASSSGRVEGRTKLMKLAFFSEYYDPDTDSLQPDERVGSFKDFFIYDHGPFSKDVMEAFSSLKDDGLIEEETELTFANNRRKVIHLTDEGRELADSFDTPTNPIRQAVSQFGDMSASDLESESLDRLGISRKMKSRYKHRDVSSLIS
jgi:DNA-binding PadR family transcriptional regulator